VLDELQLTYTSYNGQNLNSPAVSVIWGSTVLLILCCCCRRPDFPINLSMLILVTLFVTSRSCVCLVSYAFCLCNLPAHYCANSVIINSSSELIYYYFYCYCFSCRRVMHARTHALQAILCHHLTPAAPFLKTTKSHHAKRRSPAHSVVSTSLRLRRDG
jgi:hypothetical protein